MRKRAWDPVQFRRGSVCGNLPGILRADFHRRLILSQRYTHSHGPQSGRTSPSRDGDAKEAAERIHEDVLPGHRRLFRHLRHRFLFQGAVRSRGSHPVPAATNVQEACIKKCTDKFMKSSERIGLRFSEENQKLMQQGMAGMGR